MIYNNKKRLQIINYIFNKLGSKEYSKEFIGKLVYLSNKLFLLKYGCTITGDKFIAFERGTTCSETLAIMDMNLKHVDKHDVQAISTFKNTYKVTKRPNSQKVHTIFATDKLQNNFSTLSKNELKIIDIIIKRFGKMRDEEISAYTHNFLEWKNYAAKVEANSDAHITLDMDDVFNDRTFFEDDLLNENLDLEQTKVAYSIYKGDF